MSALGSLFFLYFSSFGAHSLWVVTGTSISTTFVGLDVSAMMEQKQPCLGTGLQQPVCQQQGRTPGNQRSALLPTCLSDKEDAGLWSWSPGPTWSHRPQCAGETAAVLHHGLEFTFQQLSHPLPAESTGQESRVPRRALSAVPVFSTLNLPLLPQSKA